VDTCRKSDGLVLRPYDQNGTDTTLIFHVAQITATDITLIFRVAQIQPLQWHESYGQEADGLERTTRSRADDSAWHRLIRAEQTTGRMRTVCVVARLIVQSSAQSIFRSGSVRNPYVLSRDCIVVQPGVPAIFQSSAQQAKQRNN
jgi:hypothetical protein